MNFILALVGMFLGWGVSLAITLPLMSLSIKATGREYNGTRFFFAILDTLLTRSLGFLGAAVVYSLRDTDLPNYFVIIIGVCLFVNDIVRINSLSGQPDVLDEKGYCLGGLLAIAVAHYSLVGTSIL